MPRSSTSTAAAITSAPTVIAPEFAALSRIEQHRRVYAVFGPDIGGPIHALSLVTRAEA